MILYNLRHMILQAFYYDIMLNIGLKLSFAIFFFVYRNDVSTFSKTVCSYN